MDTTIRPTNPSTTKHLVGNTVASRLFQTPPILWKGDIGEAKAQQELMESYINLAPLNKSLTLIAGADISCNKNSPVIYAGIVVLNAETLEIIERASVITETEFPYIPGYLSFREVPALLQAWQKLSTKPDAVMLDGHGVMHPRKVGVATHFGLAANVATLGCAKKRLIGRFDDPAPAQDSVTELTYQGEMRGYVYRSRAGIKPIFISPGTGMNYVDALSITRQTCAGYRLPEPTRLAHQYVNEIRVAHGEHPPTNNKGSA